MGIVLNFLKSYHAKELHMTKERDTKSQTCNNISVEARQHCHRSGKKVCSRIWSHKIPSIVSIVVNCSHFIRRDTIPRATFRTYKRVLHFQDCLKIYIILHEAIHIQLQASKEQLTIKSAITELTNLTSSNTRLMNLNESKRVKMTSDTGTPICAKGRMNHWKANASCSGVVVVKQRLALWKIFNKIKMHK